MPRTLLKVLGGWVVGTDSKISVLLWPKASSLSGKLKARAKLNNIVVQFSGRDRDKTDLEGDTLGGGGFSRWGRFAVSKAETQKREPPTKDRPPKCLKPPCIMKKIRVKVYVNDDILEWDEIAFKTQVEEHSIINQT